METLKQIVQQEIIENQFNKKLLRFKLKEIVIKEYKSFVEKAVEHVIIYMSKAYYPSKDARIEQLKKHDIEQLAISLIAGTLQYQAPYPFTAACGELAGLLGWSDKPDAVKTVGELLAVICNSDAYDINRKSDDTFEVVSRLYLSEELIRWVENTQYLPPMIVKPLEVKHNKDTGYLTVKDSLVLGKGNYHNGNICLDAINIANSVQLKLDTDFVSKYELEFNPRTKPKRKPVTEIGLRTAKDNFNHYKKMTYRTMLLIASAENKFYLTHRVDKRGRLYSCGYHINSQGTAYNKACIEFAIEEHIDVPKEFKL
jgi:hypothetical protein